MATVAELAPSWLPPELVDAWFFEYNEAGGASVPGAGTTAANIIRQDPKYRDTYDSYFPGSRRPDGSLRLTEAQYVETTSSFDDALESVGVNPDVFQSNYADLIAGGVDRNEFTGRVETMRQRVIDASPEMRRIYTDFYDLDMSEEAIIASFLDPGVGQAILDRRIAVSEIGAAASTRQYSISLEFAKRLQQEQVTTSQAQDLFGQAQMDVPVLSALAARHADPDDTFDLSEFTNAMIFDDPIQRRRMRRLVAQERATFTGGDAYLRDRATGGTTGLRER